MDTEDYYSWNRPSSKGTWESEALNQENGQGSFYDSRMTMEGTSPDGRRKPGREVGEKKTEWVEMIRIAWFEELSKGC